MGMIPLQNHYWRALNRENKRWFCPLCMKEVRGIEIEHLRYDGWGVWQGWVGDKYVLSITAHCGKCHTKCLVLGE